MQGPHRASRFSLGAGMLLIAATGFGLAATRYVIRTMLGGRSTLVDLLTAPERGWDAFAVLRRTQDIVAGSLPLFGGWTIVLPFLGPRPARGWRSSLVRRPGITACISALLGIVLGGAVMAGSALTGRIVDGRLRRPLAEWIRYFVLEQLLIYAGVAVAVAWAMQALAGRWNPSADWVDRLGRSLGVLWIASGLLWATRPYLDWL